MPAPTSAGLRPLGSPSIRTKDWVRRCASKATCASRNFFLRLVSAAWVSSAIRFWKATRRRASWTCAAR
eukprot:10009522-Alexandrium_andersonii.AAC.1